MGRKLPDRRTKFLPMEKCSGRYAGLSDNEKRQRNRACGLAAGSDGQGGAANAPVSRSRNTIDKSV